VKSIIGDVVTYYPNGVYELKVSGSNEVITKYYSAGSSRIAYRINGTVTWLLNDYLGSTVGTVDEDGELIGVLKYTAYGELRTGSSTTDYRYTGQREESEIGLYFYVARFFDPAVGRFISADTIVPDPGSSQGYDRYGYVNGNPINRNDPSGHCYDEDGDGQCDGGGMQLPAMSEKESDPLVTELMPAKTSFDIPCDKAELLAGASTMILTETIAVVLAGVGAAGASQIGANPAATFVEIMETVNLIFTPAFAFGGFMMYDSGCIIPDILQKLEP